MVKMEMMFKMEVMARVERGSSLIDSYVKHPKSADLIPYQI